MNKLKYVIFYTATVLAVSSLPSFVSIVPGFEVNTAQAAQKTKRVPALREKVYSQLARAQKLADEGNVQEGLAALDSIKERSSSMNSYEIAMMHNFYGFIYYNENRLAEAISSFEKVVAEEAIPESLKLSTLFSLAQLAMANEQYNKVISYLDDWQKLNTKDINENYYVLKAQAFYALNEYQKALQPISTLINIKESENQIPKENWLVLQRALYYSLNKPLEVVNVLEKMVKLYNKPEYWFQLAGMYGETGSDEKQLAIIEAAKQQGFVKEKSHFMQLSQAYMFNGLTYKAANTMIAGINVGVVEESEKNYSFIAESLLQAKEDKKSVSYFAKASDLVEHGNFDQRMAEVYINLEMYEEAADAARKALDKGELKFEANAYVALGMAQYNLTNFDASILAFEQAEQHKKSARLAKQWIKYVKKEKTDAELLKQALL